MSDADRQSLSGTTADFQSKAGYQKIQQTRPQTLGYGLTDSPAGQLAWNAELWTGWGDYADYLDLDTYLTHVSIYWFTRTGVSSARHYYEDARSGAGYRDVPNKVPTAVAVFPQDCDGSVFLTADGRRLDRHGAGRIVRKVARRAGITKPAGPHTLRHAFITAAPGARRVVCGSWEVPGRDCRATCRGCGTSRPARLGPRA